MANQGRDEVYIASQSIMREKANKAEKNKKRRFNLLDLIIILIVLGALFAGYLIVKSWVGSEEGGKYDIVYTAELRELDINLVGRMNGDNVIVEFIKAGDVILDSISKKELGTVVAVEGKLYREPVYNEATGKVEMAPYPGLVDVLIIIEAQAEKDKIGYKVNNFYRMNVGTRLYIRTPALLSSGYCIEFDIIEREQDSSK